jgi:F-type H+-transporting ATPase subunit delta
MNNRISRRYTFALYEESISKKKVRKVSSDLNSVLLNIQENRNLKLFFRSPVISKRKKMSVIKSLYKGKIDETVYNFILLLIDHSREDMITDIIKDFFEFRNIKEGIITAELTSAVKLDKNKKDRIIKSIEKYSGKKCFPEYVLDKELIGGFKIKFNDLVLDASIKRQLELLKSKLKESTFTKV